MMRSILILSLVLVALISCTKEDPPWPPDQQINVTFRPLWNGQPFDKYTVYRSAADERIQIQQVKFYLSALHLRGASDALLSAVELLDLTNGPKQRTYMVAPGAYDSLHIAMGLPPEVNAADITNIDPTSPLGNNSGMYWTWATMYRFLIFEGRFDTDAAATGPLPFQFSIHTGRDTCYRDRTVPFPLQVTTGIPVNLTIDVDLAHFFTDGADVLRMSDGSQSHIALEELPQALKLSDLAIKAITPR
jgi:hypothetical protein